MDWQLVPLADWDNRTTQKVARLHAEVMHTLLSELGLPIVQRYYQLAQQDSTAVGYVARTSDGQTVGWAMGTPAPDTINAGLRSPLPWFAKQMVRLLLTRPRFLLQLLRSVLGHGEQPPMAPNMLELTYIGVAPDAQRQGLGKHLLEQFVKEARERGYRSVVLSVETDNPEALHLYRQAGFDITHTFKEGAFQRHRMELKLA